MSASLARAVAIVGAWLVVAGLVLVAACAPARARDDGRYANVDPVIRDWFKSQRNQNGVSCCDESDGKRITDAEWRIAGGAYEVLINGKWRRVPDHAVLGAIPRPPGVEGAVVWIAPGSETSDHPTIWCFSPGAGI